MKLELFYFNFPFWRAEVSRLALHLGGIPFVSQHPDREMFRAMKASGELSFGQLPILKVDGKVIAQTGAIARFCGKLSGHYPSDPFLAAKVDEVIDAATDVSVMISPTMRIRDADEKRAAREQLANEKLPQWLGYFDQILSLQESGYFVGGSLTIADIAIWRLMGWISGGILDGIPKDILDPFTHLKAHFNTVASIPEIQAWMSERYNM